MVEDSGSIPPPIIYYQSIVCVTSGGYFLFLKVLGYFRFSVIINVIKKSILNLMWISSVMISVAIVD